MLGQVPVSKRCILQKPNRHETETETYPREEMDFPVRNSAFQTLSHTRQRHVVADSTNQRREMLLFLALMSFLLSFVSPTFFCFSFFLSFFYLSQAMALHTDSVQFSRFRFIAPTQQNGCCKGVHRIIDLEQFPELLHRCQRLGVCVCVLQASTDLSPVGHADVTRDRETTGSKNWYTRVLLLIAYVRSPPPPPPPPPTHTYTLPPVLIKQTKGSTIPAYTKLLLLTAISVEGSLPPYLSSSLCTYEPSRSLRSSNEELLKIPKRKLRSFEQRAFSFMTPSLWNPHRATLSLGNVPTLSQFKSHLKTLFAQGFSVEFSTLSEKKRSRCVCWM